MELSKMSQETLAQILTSMIDGGFITVDDVNSAIKLNPSNEIKREVDMFHLLLCEEDHQTNCKYYKEEETGIGVECWLAPVHQWWLERTYILKRKYEIDDSGRVPRLIRSLEETMKGLPEGLTLLLLEVLSVKKRKMELSYAVNSSVTLVESPQNHS